MDTNHSFPTMPLDCIVIVFGVLSAFQFTNAHERTVTHYNFTEEELYDSCISDSGIICFGVEKNASNPNADCILQKSCDIVVKVFSDDWDNRYFRVRFQLIGKPWGFIGPYNEGKWVAVGISMDRLMGNDSVIECRSGATSVYSSWNVGKGNNLEFKPGDEPVHYYNTNWIMTLDGIIYCDFYRDSVSVVQENIFDLSHNSDVKYYLLVAFGPTEFNDGNIVLGRHKLARSTLTPILSAKAITIPRTVKHQNNPSTTLNYSIRTLYTVYIFVLHLLVFALVE